jgi:hypothetical protein
MSSSIWTRCAGTSEIRPLRLSPWRAVESQHHVSTRKLVDTLEEQALLEELIDGAKPPDLSRRGLHYLLSTPFRYPPLKHGSRFGRRQEPGIWYGSETRATACAEVAYYRLLFLEGTDADLGTVTTQLTIFTVNARSERGIDLKTPPFDAFTPEISSPATYADSQSLGAAMRQAGVQLCRYTSARDPGRGANVAAFTPDAFGRARPRSLQSWHCTATRTLVEFRKQDYFGEESYSYARAQFLVEGRLPSPAT